MQISVVIPAYNEELNVKPLYRRLTEVLPKLKYKYEIIFVDDGSTDYTAQNVKALNKKDKRVRLVKLRRNFGKSAALSEGFKNAKGKWIITMDADLQDDPYELPRFVEQAKAGYDLVTAWRYERKDGVSKKFFSKIYNFLVRRLTGVKVHDSDCNLKLMTKELVNKLNLYGGLFRYIPSIAHSQGYKIKELKVIHHERKLGEAKFNSYGRLMRGFLDLMTIKFLISYKAKPLHAFGPIGFFLTGLGTLGGLYYLYLWYVNQWVLNATTGTRPLLTLSVLLIILGVQFISIGLLGEMIVSNAPRKDPDIVAEYV